MLIPDLPKDEHRRRHMIRSLGILDTPADERFDRLTRLACRLFDVPIALVNLVDAARVWSKSKAGITTCEVPRAASFCNRAIVGSEVFVVEDALADARFGDNCLVTAAPRVRFYAGAPLTVEPGLPLGTFCIMGVAPRHFSGEEVYQLRDFARMAEHELAALALAAGDPPPAAQRQSVLGRIPATTLAFA